MSPTQSVLILGAGFLGSGIAQVCAQAGYRVSLMDVESQAIEKALGTISSSIERLSEKGAVKETRQDVIGRMVNSGKLGRKSVEGFYRYAKDGKGQEP